MKSQLAVVMFADLVGYSALMEQDQDAAISIIRSLRNEHLEPSVASHGGEVLKRLGDGWILSFPKVAAAVDCGTDVLSRLAERAENVRLRIGCHVGEMIEDEGDFYGAGLNVAQRVQTEAPPGGLMVSEDFFRQLPKNKATGLKAAGTFRLKNIEQPIKLYQWRPERVGTADLRGVTSISVGALDYGPRDEDTAALAGDLREQLIIRMSRRVGVLVYDDVAKSVPDSTYLLRGRLRLARTRGRLSLSLVLREDGRPVWSQTYEADTEDILDFCDDILERVEGDLRLQTNAFDGDRLAHLPDDELSVSELRARAANLYYKGTVEAWEHGLQLMQRAIRLSPLDGVALSMRAEAQIMLHAARYHRPDATHLASLAEDMDLAVEQTPRSDYVFWTRGLLRITFLDDPWGAEADLYQSRELNPAYRENEELQAHIYMYKAEFDAASECFSRLIETGKSDPLQPYRLFLGAAALLCAGNAAEAARMVSQACNMRPKERALFAMRALCLDRAGDTAGAEAVRAAADRLAIAPSMVAREPVLPAGYDWIRDAMRAAVRVE